MSVEEITLLFSENVSDLIGLIGVFFVLIAYLLLQLNYWKSEDMMFSVANIVGSIFIVSSLYYNWNLSSFVIETVWIIISFYGMYSAYKARFALNKATQSKSELEK